MSLLVVLMIVEVIDDVNVHDEVNGGRQEAAIYASELPVHCPPPPADMCPDPWSRRPSGVSTFP